jgi:hypothetical protein
MRFVFALAAVLALLGCDQPMQESAAPPLQPSAVCWGVLRSADIGSGGDMRQILTVKGDGGWCSIVTSVSDGSGLPPHGEPMAMASAPQHGEVQTAYMARRTRISYRAKPGYAGRDDFVLRGVESGVIWRVEVTVVP